MAGASSLGAPTSAANGTIALVTGSSILKYTGSGHTSNRIIATSTDGSAIDASGTGTLTLTGGVTSGGGSDDLELTGTGVGVMSSVIATVGGALDKTGLGTWVLGAANTYSNVEPTSPIQAMSFRFLTCSLFLSSKNYKIMEKKR